MEETIKDISTELRTVVARFNTKELGGMLWEALSEAIRVTVKHKWKSFISFAKLTLYFFGRSLFYILKTLIKYRWKTPIIVAKDIKEKSLELHHALKVKWKSMPKDEKRNFLVDMVIFSTVAFITAGGSDLEGGLPDTDLKFGVKYHRNLFTHTILIGLAVETGVRFTSKLFLEYKKHHGYPKSPFWRKFIETVEKIDNKKEVLISGMWFGIALHLFKDSKLFSGRTKPLVGVHNLSMEGHKSILASNSFAAFLFSSAKND